MIASLLQWFFLVVIVVAVVALTDWRWGLLIAGIGGFVTSYQWERKHVRKAV